MTFLASLTPITSAWWFGAEPPTRSLPGRSRSCIDNWSQTNRAENKCDNQKGGNRIIKSIVKEVCEKKTQHRLSSEAGNNVIAIFSWFFLKHKLNKRSLNLFFQFSISFSHFSQLPARLPVQHWVSSLFHYIIHYSLSRLASSVSSYCDILSRAIYRTGPLIITLLFPTLKPKCFVRRSHSQPEPRLLPQGLAAVITLCSSRRSGKQEFGCYWEADLAWQFNIKTPHREAVFWCETLESQHEESGHGASWVNPGGGSTGTCWWRISIYGRLVRQVWYRCVGGGATAKT